MTRKLITSALLCGSLSVLLGISYAQTESSGAQQVIITKDNSSISVWLKSIYNSVRSDLAKLVTINQKINDNVTEISNYLIGDNPEPGVNAAAKYYLQANGLNDNAKYKSNINDTTKSLSNLTAYGVFAPTVNPAKAPEGGIPSYNAENNYGDFSTTSVNSLLSGDQYIKDANNVSLLLQGNPDSTKKINADQAKAALGFVQNAALANQAMPALENPGDSDEAKDYIALRKTVLSIQSVANNTLANTLVSRLPYQYDAAGHSASKLNIINNMNTENTGSSQYWNAKEKGVGAKGLLPRALDFITRFFSINYNLNNISQQLSRVNLQLAMLITQNTLIIKNNVGTQLYTEAQQAKPPLQFKKSEEEQK